MSPTKLLDGKEMSIIFNKNRATIVTKNRMQWKKDQNKKKIEGVCWACLQKEGKKYSGKKAI